MDSRTWCHCQQQESHLVYGVTQHCPECVPVVLWGHPTGNWGLQETFFFRGIIMLKAYCENTRGVYLFVQIFFTWEKMLGFQVSTSAFVSKLQSSETMYCLPMAVINPRKLQVKTIFRFRLRPSQALHGFVRHIKPSSAIWKAKISFVIVASNATIPRLVLLNITQFGDPVLVAERKTILDGLLNCIFIYPCV